MRKQWKMIALAAVALSLAWVFYLMDGGTSHTATTVIDRTDTPLPTGKDSPNSPRGESPGTDDSNPKDAATKGAAEDTPELSEADRELNERLKPLAKALMALKRDFEKKKQEGETADGKPREKFPMTKEGIQENIRSIKDDIRACYEEWLNFNPDLAGKLTVTFRIVNSEEDPTVARVIEAKVKEGGVGNAFMDGCVVASMSQMQFKPSIVGGEMAVTYPFTFSSGTEDPTALSR